MEKAQKMIKDDINFMEYSNWLIDRKSKATLWRVEKDHGKYEIICPLGLPKHFDKIVYYSLLYKLHRETKFETYAITTNRYEIAKSIFDVQHFSKNVYDRIMDSIKKWKSVSIYFEGLFYGESGYMVRGFSIIDQYNLNKETGELTIKFNEMYIKQLKETKFYKLIDFEQYKKLHKASSARLYEILIKSYKERNEWAINIQALAEKLTFEKREGAQSYYPSDILRYIKPGINEINKKTDLAIDFQYNKETHVCVFKKLAKKKVSFIAATKDVELKKTKKTGAKDERSEYLNLFKILSEEEKLVILDDIKKEKFLGFLPDQDSRIFAFMKSNEKWQLKK